MSHRTPPVVLISGASSGIGLACAERLARAGYRVFGTSRTAPPLEPTPCPGTPGAIEMLPLDVDDDASVERAVALVRARAGRIDAVVSNAGFGIAGAVEDTTIAEAKAQFETAFFGAWRVYRAVLPVMRAQGGGRIVAISSIAGVIPIPFQAAYSAAKAALESLSEALSAEVKPFGIHVSLIQPGDVPTGFTARRRRTMACETNPAYRERFERALGAMETAEREGPPPDIVARVLERALAARRPRLRYTVGPVSERAAVALKRVLPARVWERVLMLAYGL